VGLDAVSLVYTSNPIILYFSGLVLLLLVRNDAFCISKPAIIRRLRQLLTKPQGCVLTFFFAHLIFLLMAYVTRNQPEIWPRYGLIFFTLGLPLLAYGLALSQPFTTPHSSRNLRLLYLTGGFMILQFCVQLIDVTRIVVKPDTNLIAAQFLEDQRRLDEATTIYCEDGAIRVLSGIPLEEFKDQYNSPADENAFIESLRKNQVKLLVYKDLPGSRLKEIIAKISGQQKRTGITLEKIVPLPRNQVDGDTIVYRVHEGDVAEVTSRFTPAKRNRRLDSKMK